MSVIEAVVITVALILIGGGILSLIVLVLRRREPAVFARGGGDPQSVPKASIEAFDSGGISLLSESDTSKLPVLARIGAEVSAAPS